MDRLNAEFSRALAGYKRFQRVVKAANIRPD